MSEISDKPLPYERDRPNAYEWTDRAYDMLVAGQLEASVHRRQNLEVAVVVGACPRCRHAFRFETTNAAIGVGGRTLGPAQPGPTGEARPADDYVPVTASCTCSGEHTGRQANEHGCGITFRVETLPEEHHD